MPPVTDHTSNVWRVRARLVDGSTYVLGEFDYPMGDEPGEDGYHEAIELAKDATRAAADPESDRWYGPRGRAVLLLRCDAIIAVEVKLESRDAAPK